MRGSGMNFARLSERAELPIGRIRIDDAVGKAIIRGPAVGLVPAVGRLETESAAKLEARCCLPGVLDEACSEQRPPAKLRWRRHNRKGRDGSLQEGAEGRERRLSILVLGQVVIGLQPLQPRADFNLVSSVGPENMLVHREQVTYRLVVAAGVRARERNLRGAIRCRAS